MKESQTFSQLVDDAVLRSGRRDRIEDLISHVRATMRECLTLRRFYSSLVEDSILVDATPFIWTRPDLLQSLIAVKYPYYTNHGRPVFAIEKIPGTKTSNDSEYTFYLSGNSYVFSGLEIGVSIGVAYLSYFRRLVYYPETARPARFDLETESWVYHANYNGSDVLKQTARDLTTNWLLMRWYELVLEGTLAKLYKVVGDPRMNASYALYKQQQTDLISAEQHVIVGA